MANVFTANRRVCRGGAVRRVLGAHAQESKPVKREYGISLAGWSLHRTIGADEGIKRCSDLLKKLRG